MPEPYVPASTQMPIMIYVVQDPGQIKCAGRLIGEIPLRLVLGNVYIDAREQCDRPNLSSFLAWWE
jgi:hypothetical protein